MSVTKSGLDSALLGNVCEIQFVRKRPIAGKPATRRMLCTKSHQLLNSVNGKTSLNYKAPKGAKQFNESTSNVLLVWDIMMQNYRKYCN